MAAYEHRDIDGNEYRLHNLEYIVFLKATKGNETLIESFISNGNSTNFKNLNRSTQLLRKIIDVVKEGQFFNLKNIVASEIYEDHLQISEFFLLEGYKDPAAVVAGTTLESHLKEFCKQSDIPISKIGEKGKEIFLKKIS